MAVILASQTHQVPQVGWPHKDPVIIARQVNSNPIGATLFEIKVRFFNLKIKVKKDKNEINENVAKPIHAEGT